MLEYAVVENMWTQNTKVMPIILPLIQKPPKKSPVAIEPHLNINTQLRTTSTVRYLHLYVAS